MTTPSLHPDDRERIVRYASGNASLEESAAVERLLESSEEAQKELRDMRAVWERLGDWEADVDESVFQPAKLRRAVREIKERKVPAWQRLAERVWDPSWNLRPAWVGVPSVVCLFACAGVWVYLPGDGELRNDPRYAPVAVQPERKPVKSILAGSGDRDHEAAEALFAQILRSAEEAPELVTLYGPGISAVAKSPLRGQQPTVIDSFTPESYTQPDQELYSYASLQARF